MGSLKVFGIEIPIITRDKDIKKEFKPSLTELFEAGGLHTVLGRLFRIGVMQLIDYNVGAFGSCVGYRVIICHYSADYAGGQLILSFDLDHEYLRMIELGRACLEVRICRDFGFSSGVFCSIMDEIRENEKANRSSD